MLALQFADVLDQMQSHHLLNDRWLTLAEQFDHVGCNETKARNQ